MHWLSGRSVTRLLYAVSPFSFPLALASLLTWKWPVLALPSERQCADKPLEAFLSPLTLPSQLSFYPSPLSLSWSSFASCSFKKSDSPDNSSSRIKKQSRSINPRKSFHAHSSSPLHKILSCPWFTWTQSVKRGNAVALIAHPCFWFSYHTLLTYSSFST